MVSPWAGAGQVHRSGYLAALLGYISPAQGRPGKFGGNLATHLVGYLAATATRLVEVSRAPPTKAPRDRTDAHTVPSRTPLTQPNDSTLQAPPRPRGQPMARRPAHARCAMNTLHRAANRHTRRNAADTAHAPNKFLVSCGVPDTPLSVDAAPDLPSSPNRLTHDSDHASTTRASQSRASPRDGG
jgi:hypothetical protein